MNAVEPPYYGYQRTEAALQNYLALADQDHSASLPEVQKTLAPGDAYAGAEALAQRLQLVGDLPKGPVGDVKPGIYDGPLVDGVKHFQSRHGLNADGRLGKDTLAPAEHAVSLFASSSSTMLWKDGDGCRTTFQPCLLPSISLSLSCACFPPIIALPCG